MFKRVRVTDYGNYHYKLTKTDITFASNRSHLKNFWKTDNEKYANNIIRAKTKLYDYCKCNVFTYFFTGTINPKNDRSDLNWLIRTTSQIVRDCRKKYGGEWKYILIPEKHKNRFLAYSWAFR